MYALYLQDMTQPVKLISILREVIFLILGVSAASLGLKGFLLPNGYLDGGVTGFSLLINKLSGLDLSLLILGINIPFIYLGIKQISVQFALKSFFSILLLAILIHYVEFPVITEDKLLIAVFGGFFLGCGIGLSIRGGGVIDGTEVLAITISRRSTLSVGDFIAIFNLLLFSLSALLFSIEIAMYSMLTYLAASKTIDFIINGIEEYIGVSIISDHSVEIREEITKDLGFGITIYNAYGGHGKTGSKFEVRTVIYCVTTRLEVSKLITLVENIDENAFIIQQPVRDTRGGMIKKRPLH